MAAPNLTPATIADAMARAEKVACSPTDDRCYPLAYSVADAEATLDANGRCVVGWIVANSGRDAWDVLLDTRTGEGRLHRWSA